MSRTKHEEFLQRNRLSFLDDRRGHDGGTRDNASSTSPSSYSSSSSSDTNPNIPLWWQGVNGFDPKTLKLWQELWGGSEIRLDDFQLDSNAEINNVTVTKKDPKDPNGPHAIGCSLSHWTLVRQLQYNQRQHIHSGNDRPVDYYIVFEDDAVCSSDLHSKISNVVRRLPSDWDMLYLGGKPFSLVQNVTYTYTYPHPHTHRHGGDVHDPATQNKEMRRTINEFFKHDDETNNNNKVKNQTDFCSRVYRTATGPLAPDGSRHLRPDQPYWKINYMTNIEAYVVNSRSLDKVLNVLDPYGGHDRHGDYNFPGDIRLANAMNSGDLNVFMSPQKLCFQEGTSDAEEMQRVGYVGWDGYLWETDTFTFVWRPILDCLG
jgi:hypothetical protein